jgi:hypothetical protein
MPVLKRFLIYLLPVYLTLIEWAMDKVHVIGHSNALGPTLAAVALGLLGPTVVPKVRTIENKESGVVHPLRVFSPRDIRICEIGWIILLLFLILWPYILYLSERPERDVNIDIYIVLLPTSVVIGMATYIIGIIFSELKEVS